MTRFLDGPAAGRTLWLRRAPLFLRFVMGPTGGGDALDMPEDIASDDETMTVYERVTPPRYTHVRMSGSRHGSRSGVYYGADYRLVKQPPDDRTARSNSAWREWSNAKAAARGHQ